MRTPALNNRGLAVLAAILMTTAATTLAEARIGLSVSGPMQHGMTTTMAPGWTRGYGTPKYPPPYAPPCYYGHCPRSPSSADQGGGGTGGFSPGGGSGTKPIKKPNLQ
jgi:hypothetical protein